MKTSEKLFKNETTYDQDVYLQFLKFHGKVYNFSYTLYTVFWALLLLLCIYISFGSNTRLQGVLLTIVLICFIIYRIYRPKMIANKELKSEKISNNITNTFVFYDNGFNVENKNGNFNYKYFSLYKIFETSDYFYLYIRKENAFLLSKKTFSFGTPEDFSTFIKNKCRLKYKRK